MRMSLQTVGIPLCHGRLQGVSILGYEKAFEVIEHDTD